MKKLIWQRMQFLIKFLIAGTLVYIILKKVEWQSSLIILINISVPYIILLLLISILMIGVSCIKWQIFLHARRIKVSLIRLILLYLVGYFFSNFLPGNVGGDVVRSFVLGKEIHNTTESFSSVFLERFTGLLALSILAVICVMTNQQITKSPEIVISLFFFLALILFIFLAFITEKVHAIFSVLAKIESAVAMINKIKRFFDAIYYFRGKPLILSKAMALSFLFQIMTILNTLVVCHSLKLHISVSDIAVVVPIILVISMLPISINSIGVWEGSFVYFFSLIGVSAPEALSIALVLRAKNLFIALFGGIVFATWKRLPGREAICA